MNPQIVMGLVKLFLSRSSEQSMSERDRAEVELKLQELLKEQQELQAELHKELAELRKRVAEVEAKYIRILPRLLAFERKTRDQ